MNQKNIENTISLCMIVKNEEEFLPQCLDSVKEIVDEMIIVDTGSTDRTLEIAKSYGARVYEHPWQGSFSEARNYGLQYATCEWILQLDADEALEKEDIPILREALRLKVYNAISVALLNKTPEGWSKHYFQRIFRRGKGKYEGIVHNQLVFSGAELRSEIRVYHWGYNLSKDKMAAKYIRTQNLLQKQIEENPQNAFAHQNYVRILRSQKNYDEAIKAGQKALKVCKDTMSDVSYQMIACDTAYSMMSLSRVNEANKLADRVLKLNPQNLDFIFLMGSISVHRGQFENAVNYFKKFLKIKAQEAIQPKHTDLIVDSYSHDAKAHYHIADCLCELQRYSEALESINLAILTEENQPNFYITKAKCLCNLSQPQDALEVINKAKTMKLEIKDKFFVLLASLQKKHKELGNPEETLEEGLKEFPDSDELYNRLAFELYPKDKTEAARLWKKAVELNENHLGARIGLARYAAEQNDPETLRLHAVFLAKKLKKLIPLREIANLCIRFKLYDEVIDLLTSYLSIKDDDVNVLLDLSTCYMKLNQYEAAFLGYQHALRLSPGNSLAINNLKILEKKMKTE